MINFAEYAGVLEANGCESFKKFSAAFGEAIDSMCEARNEINKELKSAYLGVAKAKFELAAKFYKDCDEDIRKAFADFEKKLEEERV